MFLSCQVWISRSKYLSDFPQFYRNFSAIFPKVISIYFSIFWFLIFFRFSIYRSFLGQFPLGSFSRNFSLRSALVSEGGLTNPPSCLPVQPWPGSKLVRSQGLSTPHCLCRKSRWPSAGRGWRCVRRTWSSASTACTTSSRTFGCADPSAADESQTKNQECVKTQKNCSFFWNGCQIGV